MKVAYVAGPYRATKVHYIVENIQKASQVALELWKIGYATICPHRNTGLFDGATSDEVWLKGGLEFLRRSNVVVVIPGWEYSQGSKAEIEEAKRLGIPVYYWPQDIDLLNRAIRVGFFEGGSGVDNPGRQRIYTTS